jgi:hypothetical protein
VSHGDFIFPANNKTTVPMEGLVWFLIEAAVALALLVLIVWWTLPRRRRKDDDEPPK